MPLKTAWHERIDSWREGQESTNRFFSLNVSIGIHEFFAILMLSNCLYMTVYGIQYTDVYSNSI